MNLASNSWPYAFLISALSLMTGCTAEKPAEPNSELSRDSRQQEVAPRAPKPQTPTYQGQILENTRLFPTTEKAQQFFSGNLDDKEAMVKDGELESMPAIAKEQSVTVNRQADGDFRFITTADGKSGYVISTLVEAPPKSVKELADDSPTGEVFNDSVKSNGWPKHWSESKPLTVQGLQYNSLKVKRQTRIGTEGKDDGWAEADSGFTFVVVTYRAKNISKKEQDVPNFQALIDDTGQIYPAHMVGTYAARDQMHAADPTTIRPGQSITAPLAFYVPENMPTSKLSFTVPDCSGPCNYQYKVALK